MILIIGFTSTFGRLKQMNQSYLAIFRTIFAPQPSDPGRAPERAAGMRRKKRNKVNGIK